MRTLVTLLSWAFITLAQPTFILDTRAALQRPHIARNRFEKRACAC